MVLFDTPNVEAEKPYEMLPEGVYRLMVIDAEVKATGDDKKGQGIALVFEVIDGPHKGGQCRQLYNIVNKSAQAQQIGQGQFKTLLEALGVTEPLIDESSLRRHLINKTVWGKVVHEEYNGYKNAKFKHPVKPEKATPIAKPVVTLTNKTADADIPF